MDPVIGFVLLGSRTATWHTLLQLDGPEGFVLALGIPRTAPIILGSVYDFMFVFCFKALSGSVVLETRIQLCSSTPGYCSRVL